MRAVERTIDKKGQLLLIPEIELEGWWTTLDLPPKDVIRLYEDHGTSEQFHSEIKTDMDIERLPSGKFSTNALILTLGGLAYNILRAIGQMGLVDGMSPVPSSQAAQDQDCNAGTDVPGCSTGKNRPSLETALQPPLSRVWSFPWRLQSIGFWLRGSHGT
jgi:hypothetical protein